MFSALSSHFGKLLGWHLCKWKIPHLEFISWIMRTCTLPTYCISWSTFSFTMEVDAWRCCIKECLECSTVVGVIGRGWVCAGSLHGGSLDGCPYKYLTGLHCCVDTLSAPCHGLIVGTGASQLATLCCWYLGIFVRKYPPAPYIIAVSAQACITPHNDIHYLTHIKVSCVHSYVCGQSTLVCIVSYHMLYTRPN